MKRKKEKGGTVVSLTFGDTGDEDQLGQDGNRLESEDKASTVEFRPHIGMRILAEPSGSDELYFGTIIELILREEDEYVKVRWAVSQEHEVIPCLSIFSCWNKNAKVGELVDCGQHELPSTPNKWFDTAILESRVAWLSSVSALQ
jgi:hypothetical protein